MINVQKYLVLAGALAAAACSSGSGVGTTADASATPDGGNDYGLPPAAQGAVSIRVDPLLGCGAATGAWANVPSVSGGGVPITADTVLQEGTDGDGGTQIQCKVAATGSGFSLSVSAAAEKSTAVTLSVAQITVGAVATGELQVVTPDTNGTYRSPADKPCAFTVTGGIGLGKIWGSVTCDAIEDPSRSTATGEAPSCTVQSGYFRFENCEE